MTVQIRRASARFVDKAPGRATWHSFSFGGFYDPDRVGFGPMVCHDEHLLGNGKGFSEHPHEGVDIVTYVISGALAHHDSLGNEGVLSAGELGWLRASSGVQHSEIAVAPATRFVQVWLQQYDGEPAWQRVPLDDGITGVEEAGVSAVVRGSDQPALSLPAGDLHVLRLAAGERVVVPSAPMVHLYVATGALLRHSLAEPLSAGDTLLVTAVEHADEQSPAESHRQTQAETPTETHGLEIAAATEAVVLVWTIGV